MLPYVLHESMILTIYQRMWINLVYLQHAAVCPTCIYETDYISKNVNWFGLSSTCCRMSYMHLRNRLYIKECELIWFIFNMLPYVLHASTKPTIYLRMWVNLVYFQHAAVCPTWIYDIDYISKNVNQFALSSTCCRMSYMHLRNRLYI